MLSYNPLWKTLIDKNMKKICNRKNKMFGDVILMLEKYVIKKIKEIKTKTYNKIIIKSNECTYEWLRVIEFE